MKKELKRGEVGVNKKELDYLFLVWTSVENNIDVIMAEKESFDRGKKIAKEMNRLTMARQGFQHFQLNIPLKKLK
jgi:hypothetical protein